MIATVDQFIAAIRECGLVESDDLREVETRLGRPAKDVQELASLLVKFGKLTRYQARQVYVGKAKALVLGQYVVIDHIGAGGMGQVYKARHRKLGREVALKLLPAAATRLPESVRRFERELRAAARLVHPNVVHAFDAEHAGNAHFLVMEYVDGQDLRSLVKANGPLSVEKAVDCIMQAARGLQYAHEQGVIHRDIKPANMLLAHDGTLKILDLGLALMQGPSEQPADPAQSEMTQSGIILGTVDYMSPEQAENTRLADARSDIYSLGCSLYYLLAGKPPYSAETTLQKLMAHRGKPYPSLRGLRSDVPPDLDAICARMMAKRPEERYASMAEVIADLKSGRATPGPGGATAGDRELSSFLNAMETSSGSPVAGSTAPAGGESGARPASVSGKYVQAHKQQDRLYYALAAAVVVIVLVAIVLGRGGNGQPAKPPKQAPTKVEPPKNIAPAAITLHIDQQAALRAIDVGGELDLLVDGKVRRAKRAKGIPDTSFRVQGLHFDGRSTVTNADMRLFAQLEALETLTISGTRIVDLGIVELAGSKSLRRLYAAGLALTDRSLEPIKRIGTLEELDLSRTQITSGGLAAFHPLDKLQTLRLQGNPQLTDEGLACLAGMPRLKQLRLSGTKIKGTGFVGMRLELATLDLSSCPLSHEGLEALVAAAPQLEELVLTRTPVWDARLPLLKLKVTTLALNETGITDEGVSVLGTTTTLKSLNVARTGLTAAGVARLKEMLPECQITSDAPSESVDSPAPDAGGWIVLFDGQQLRGCRVLPAACQENWRIAEGVLRSSGEPSMLLSNRADLPNVHFRCELCINERGNSGQYVRRTSWFAGYEAEVVGAGAGSPMPTGALWAEGLRIAPAKPPPDFGAWFTQEVIAFESRLMIRINGQTVVDLTDDRLQLVAGAVGLRHHTPQTEVQVRRIEFRPLRTWPELAPAG